MTKDIEKILNGCFRPKEGRPNLLKIPVNVERARQHIDKAHKNLRAMKIMFENNLFDWTIICGYYAMYHAVLAAWNKARRPARGRAAGQSRVRSPPWIRAVAPD